MSRLITFGCSHTAGAGLSVEDTWAFKLAKLLDKQLCNQGIDGNSIKGISWNISTYDYQSDDYVVILWTVQNRWTVIKEAPYHFLPTGPIPLRNSLIPLNESWYRNYHSELDDNFISESFIKYADSFLFDRDIKALHMFSHRMYHSTGLLTASEYSSKLRLKSDSFNKLHFYEDYRSKQFYLPRIYSKASDGLHLGKKANEEFSTLIYNYVVKPTKNTI